MFDIESASPRYSSAHPRCRDLERPGRRHLPRPPPRLPVVGRGDHPRGHGRRHVDAYDAARTLQNWMRDPTSSSTASTSRRATGTARSRGSSSDVSATANSSPGTYRGDAANASGIPLGVAVGFTSGSSDGQGNYSVLGRNAHAWPEVWFDDIGWVPFEPTPGRGAPNAQEYTGHRAAAGPRYSEATEPPRPPCRPPTVDAAPSTDRRRVPAPPTTITDRTRPGCDRPRCHEPTAVAPTSTDEGGGSLEARCSLAVARRRSPLTCGGPTCPSLQAVAPSARLGQLWTRATSALAETGVVAPSDLTPRSGVGDRATFPVAARPMQSARRSHDDRRVRPGRGSDWLGTDAGYGRTTLENCVSWCRQIERAVADTRPGRIGCGATSRSGAEVPLLEHRRDLGEPRRADRLSRPVGALVGATSVQPGRDRQLTELLAARAGGSRIRASPP